ncbi:RNA polymerase sporulation-specific sigma factor, partial [Fictibacillus solisalsi]
MMKQSIIEINLKILIVLTGMLFVSYVKNKAFPQPLSENEEKEYLKRMAEG